MEATGIAAEIGAKRRLQRKARPRSGSPRLIVAFRTALTIFGIDCITTGSVVVGTGINGAISTESVRIGADVRISAGIVGGAGGTSWSPWATG